MVPALLRRHIRIAQADLDASLALDGFGGIGQDSSQEHLHLGLVYFNMVGIRRQVGMQFHIGGHAVADQTQCVLDKVVGGHDLRLEFAPPRIGQQLAGQLDHFLAGLADGLHIAVDLFIAQPFHLDQFQVAQYHRQCIVELVGDATGQGSDSLHLLGLQQSFR